MTKHSVAQTTMRQPTAADLQSLASRFRLVPDPDRSLRAEYSASGLFTSTGEPWLLRGAGEQTVAAFRVAASFAATVLGLGEGADAWLRWLDCLRQHGEGVLRPGSTVTTWNPVVAIAFGQPPEDQCVREETGSIERVVEVSVEFCERLSTEAARLELETGIDAVEVVPVDPEPAAIEPDQGDYPECPPCGSPEYQELRQWRRHLIHSWRRKNTGLSMPEFARQILSMSVGTVDEIVKEYRKDGTRNYSMQTQRRFLRIIGATVDQWYRVPRGDDPVLTD